MRLRPKLRPPNGLLRIQRRPVALTFSPPGTLVMIMQGKGYMCTGLGLCDLHTWGLVERFTGYTEV
ncbi:hypothetical protein DASB73_034870 [Starmerella bacillaris]|uniref:Uncharacterized protein n=1 Tax=Starmerella bacillaris TaxID=1247836 RepID=A0AAV5RLX5_STABA|nr:hypothetical protein DASB73_034870 [Starmerella bacillaris]